MIAPFYRVAKASAQVLALLGDPVPRIYPWGENNDAKRLYPYVTFKTISGSPDNYLSGLPDVDRCSLQVDVWAKSTASVEVVAKALRDAIELDCHITAWRGDGIEPATKVYRISFDCDWIVQRKN